MKKNVHFAALLPWNLALITHNAPSSVNPSICNSVHLHTFDLKQLVQSAVLSVIDLCALR